MEERYLQIQMWLFEVEAKGKAARFRLPSAFQKRACLRSLILMVAEVKRLERIFPPVLFSPDFLGFWTWEDTFLLNSLDMLTDAAAAK